MLKSTVATPAQTTETDRDRLETNDQTISQLAKLQKDEGVA